MISISAGEPTVATESLQVSRLQETTPAFGAHWTRTSAR